MPVLFECSQCFLPQVLIGALFTKGFMFVILDIKAYFRGGTQNVVGIYVSGISCVFISVWSCLTMRRYLYSKKAFRKYSVASACVINGDTPS